MKLHELYENVEVNLYDKVIGKLRITKKLPKWDGLFNCDNRELTSLKGCPDEVNGSFYCSHNNIKDLNHSPFSVQNDFIISNNKNLVSLEGAPKKVYGRCTIVQNTSLESLKGCPQYIGENFECQNNNLYSLEGCPEKIFGEFNCCHNNLVSLKGGPKSAKNFLCNYNKLTSLEYAPTIINGNLECFNNEIKSFKDVHKHIHEISGGFMYAYSNPLESHILGLLKIKGLKYVQISNTNVQVILNKYLKEPFGNKRVIDCQSELLDAGFDEFAQL